MRGTPVLMQTEELGKAYSLGKTIVPAVSDVDLVIHRGEFVAVMGPSGCGKSTLLYLIGGLATPTGGRVIIDGTDITQLSDGARTAMRRDKIGFVFQRFNLFPTLTALGNVCLAQEIQGWQNGHGDMEQALKLLAWVGLEGKADRRPTELSIGEQQRVAIARALVNRPEILLADEPTGNLDSENARQVLRVFEALNAEHQQTIMMITHNPEVAARAHRKILMRDGRIVSLDSTN
ncbi:MAG: ABC transporter ATP-binding protein [Acidobacteriota bacterium]